MSGKVPNKDNIILIGMPGVGKSTLGVVLAKRMRMSFLDTDLLIQSHMGKTLQEIIAEMGAEGFLETEGRILSGLECSRTVVATGGSAVYSKDAMATLGRRGVVVYLKTGYEELRERLGEDIDERGVAFRGGVETLRDLYNERCPLYEEACDLSVDVGGMGIREAVELLSGMLS